MVLAVLFKLFVDVVIVYDLFIHDQFHQLQVMHDLLFGLLQGHLALQVLLTLLYPVLMLRNLVP